jgi:hypothetical protein
VGIRGTFVLSGVYLNLAVVVFALLFFRHGGWPLVGLFFGVQLPTVVYFLWWARSCFVDPAKASFGRAMGMNLMASSLMVVFFVIESLP